MSETLKVFVNQDSPRSAGEEAEINVKGTKRGELCAADFYTQMALEGRVYSVRAGTITTPLTGDVNITDAAAEMTADAQTGFTIIPVWCNIEVEVAGGTLPECALKSVGAISTAGTAFIPLPLYLGGAAAATTARVSAAGGCTVTAETVTTTRRHFSNLITAVGDAELCVWQPRVPPILVGPACFYVQVAATTTGCDYFAAFNYIELPTINVS